MHLTIHLINENVINYEGQDKTHPLGGCSYEKNQSN